MQSSSPAILGVILARGGSKAIPKKSIAPLCGKPLMYYTIKAAQGSRLLTRLIISTDDEEMAAVAKRYGVEVPFMRPKELAEDLTPDLPVFEHALAWLKEHENYVPDVVVHLRPTTPLKSAEDIDRGVQLLLDHPEADAVRSVSLPAHTPFKMWTIGQDRYMQPILAKEFPEVFEKHREPFNMPRQLLPEIWRHVGYVDVIRTPTITEKHSMSGTKILPLFFDEWRDIDIDSPRELEHAEKIVQSHPEFQDKPAPLEARAAGAAAPTSRRGLPLTGPAPFGLAERLRAIKAVALDGDGVIFSGRVWMHPQRGELLKERSFVDGQGISLLRACGIRIAFVSGEAAGFVETVGARLNALPSVKSGAWLPIAVFAGPQGKDKVTAIEGWLGEFGISWPECAAMGDDLGDYELLDKAGVAACPANAEAIIRDRADFIAARKGGDGAIRDLANAILAAKGIDVKHLALR